MKYLIILFVFCSTNSYSQNTLIKTFATTIPTNFADPPVMSPTCNGPLTTLSFSLPSGGPYIITKVTVEYSMLAGGGGWMSDQRSKIFCQNTGMQESQWVSGIGDNFGTYSYSRDITSIAPDTLFSGSNVTFEMWAARTYNGNHPGCGTLVNRVVANTWTIKVYFNEPSSNIKIGNDTSAMLDLNSTTKGFLMPRMTSNQRDAIFNPEEGLQVYNLDDHHNYLFDGEQWVRMNQVVAQNSYEIPGNTWTNKRAFAGDARHEAVAFSIGNYGYVGTGNVYKKDFWEYNSIIPGNLAVDGRITNSLKFPSTIHDKKIVLYDRPASSSYLGFGVEPYTLRYQVASSGDKHEFGPLLTLYGTGDAVLSGCLTTVNFNCPSDLRLKKNILPMANSLSHLLALKGYRYNWIDANKNTTKQSGVLAQEVQEIFPHLVQENHKGMLSVNYIGLVPEIIETFKEIKSQSDKMSSDLLKRIEVLENQKKNQHER